MDIRSDRQKGMSYTELGKRYQMDPRTAKKYAESAQKPKYTLTEPKPTKLDAYKQQIDQWLKKRHTRRYGYWKSCRNKGLRGSTVS